MQFEDFKKMLDDVATELERLKQARYHIKKRIHLFPPEDLACMASDGIIRFEDIPPEKQTDFVRVMLELQKQEV